LEAIAVGLDEVLEEDYLKYRIRSVEYFGNCLSDLGLSIIQPPGGHAVYLDAAAMLPHLPPSQFPAQALVCELYAIGGIRGVEVGSSMFGGKDPLTGEVRYAAMELVRLALPRRVYTQSHIDYAIEILGILNKNKETIQGLKMVWEAPVLRHFTAQFEPIS
jgi:tyrosine phenol-lyase